MTIPTFTGYDTALRGLEAEQVAIDTTGQNIDNVSTPGYTREKVNLAESDPLQLQAGSTTDNGAINLGSGVDADSISRIRNQFLDVQYRAQNTSLGSANASLSSLTQAQAAFDEPGANGLSSAMNTFYNSWGNLANASPDTAAAAGTTVVSNAEAMASQFNSLSSQLSTIQTQAGTQLSDLTSSSGQLSSDANQIAKLNGQINVELAAGQSPNTLEDQRDSLIDDVSSLGSVSVTDPGNGLLSITFGGSSTPLVSGTTVNWPPATPTAATGGELGALAKLADTSSSGALSPYLTQLDTVAAQLISTVNGITNAPTSATPYNFFSGTNASTIAVNSAVTASSITATGENSVAATVAAVPGSAADTANPTYDALVAQVGSDVKTATSTQSNTQAIVTAVENQRESVSSVSVDEEMTNLLSYQQGYQASARVLNTMNSVINDLLSAVN